MAKPVASIDTLADYLVSGFWKDTDTEQASWAENTITYNVTGGTSPQRIFARGAFDEWERVANLNFVETTEAADITLVAGASGTGAGCPPVRDGSGHLPAMTITIAKDWDDGNFAPGGYGYETLIHEIGHALGLGHQGPYDNGAGGEPIWANDTRQFSVMSYIERDQFDGSSDGRAVTPMLADIAAIQQMYGANTTAASGNTTYGYNGVGDGYFLVGDFSPGDEARCFTIYDRGGTDTIDNSGSARNGTIDLRAGTFSSIAGATHNVAIDFDSTIENAVGGSASDTIIGNAGVNELKGGLGNDTLQGLAGQDILVGGDDIDTASYETEGPVSASLWSGKATTGAVTDSLLTIENLEGSQFADQLGGDAGVNRLEGNGGDDGLAGLAGSDTLIGGGGTDTASYSGENIAVTADLVASTAISGASTDKLSGIENLQGTALADTLLGNVGANKLEGLGGDDRLLGREGFDILNGGAGIDTAFYTGNVAAISGDLVKGKVTKGAGTDTLVSVENLEGSSLADQLGGDNGANRLTGSEGDDQLAGRAGADVLDGGSGTDLASYVDETGSVSADLLAGKATTASGTDTLTSIENLQGSNFADDLKGDAGNNRLEGLRGADTISGGEGIDTVSYAGEETSVTGDLASGKFITNSGTDTLSGIENIEGSALADSLRGDDGINRLEGRNGNDFLAGRGGSDILDGGSGIDIASFEDETLAVNASLITDQAKVGKSTDNMISIESLTGTAFDDILIGDAGRNTLSGLDGDDWLWGGVVNDTEDAQVGVSLAPDIVDFMSGGDGVDTASYAGNWYAVQADLATNTAVTKAGRDLLLDIENLEGSAANDDLSGDEGDNKLAGGIGNDHLTGGDGTDILSGGAGADMFEFSLVSESGVSAMDRDVISDFGTGDRIDLNAIDADITVAGDQAFDWIGRASLSGAAQVSFQSEGRNGLLLLSVDSDAAAEMTIGLASIGSLEVASFVL